MKKLSILMVLFLLVVLVGCSKDEKAAKPSYPTKAIELVVPYSPGGATDVAARIVANAANKYMPNGQSVVVTNKPGGGGVIAAAEMAKEKSDGYKLIYTSTTPACIAPLLGNVGYKDDSFQTIARALTYSQVLVVRKDSQWETFEQWLEWVKQNPDKFTYGTQGVGTTAHLTMEELAFAEGLKIKHVPYAGAALAQQSLLGSHINGIACASTDINKDELRMLVDFGSKRNPRNPDIPTLTEKGTKISHDLFSGVAAPKGLGKDELKVLEEVFEKAVNDPETKERISKAGLDPAYLNSVEFQKVISEEYKAYEVIIKEIGLRK